MKVHYETVNEEAESSSEDAWITASEDIDRANQDAMCRANND